MSINGTCSRNEIIPIEVVQAKVLIFQENKQHNCVMPNNQRWFGKQLYYSSKGNQGWQNNQIDQQEQSNRYNQHGYNQNGPL
jgi:hypothetical protein